MVDEEHSDPSSGGEGVPELSASSWHARDEQAGAASLGVMARGLPRLVGQAVRWAFAASPRNAVTAIAFTVAAGVFTAVGLFATTSVLGPLFSEGPTPDRVWAALPALVVVGAATVARALLSAASGWAQARLEPCVNELVGRRIFEQTTLVELRAYDDPGFYETLQRARDRGLMEAPRMVSGVADIATGLAGWAAGDHRDVESASRSPAALRGGPTRGQLAATLHLQLHRSVRTLRSRLVTACGVRYSPSR